MKKIILSVFILATSIKVNAQISFAVSNNTKLDFSGIFVTPSEKNSWGSNLVEGLSFESGATYNMDFASPATNCYFDLKITQNNGSKDLIFKKIDMCNDMAIFWINQDSKGNITYKVENSQNTLNTNNQTEKEVSFAISNDTKLDFSGLFVKPSQKTSWGLNLVEGFSFEPEATYNIDFASPATNCIFDLKIVGHNGMKDVIFKEIDMCNHMAILYVYEDLKGKLTYRIQNPDK